MIDFTKDGNRVSSQEFFCSARYIGKHVNIFIATLNILISFTAFFGNVLIILALPNVTSLHSSSKLLFRSLAITDLCVGLILPVYISTLVGSSENSELCYYLETIFKVPAIIFSGVSLLTLTAISVDRLLALLLGIRYRTTVTLTRVRVCVTLIWLSTIASAFTYLYSYFINLALVATGLLFCIITSTFCYTKIFLTLRHHQFQVQNRVHQDQPNEGEIPLNIARYRKTVSIAMWVQMALVACYLPFATAAIVVSVTDELTMSRALVWELTTSLVEFNSSLNPLLYCWKIRGVRQAVKEIVRKCFCLSSLL